MTASSVSFRNGRLFDGTRLLEGYAARFEGGVLSDLCPDTQCPASLEEIDLGGDILFPGYVDLQVNGGDGILFNDDPSVAGVRRIAAAHRRLGVTSLLPTLITDTRDVTRAAIDAVRKAVREGVPGIAGLHLEGPHLSVARKGAHDPTLIRPMEVEDLQALVEAAEQLPVLKVTVAPENVTEEQVQTLSRAGILVSLGHTDADFATCRRYAAAGARCVTHLFNAMSQLGNREPGLVGAALADGELSAGLIADAVHVHPETIRAAWSAKTGPGSIFLVSDAMAVAGSDLTEFELGGRLIRRREGILTLEDGTLAGADLELTTALRVMVNDVGIDLAAALLGATSVPAELIGHAYGFEKLTDVVRIASDLSGVVPTGAEADS